MEPLSPLEGEWVSDGDGQFWRVHSVEVVELTDHSIEFDYTDKNGRWKLKGISEDGFLYTGCYQVQHKSKTFLFRRFNERPEGIYLVGRWLNPAENGAGLWTFLLPHAMAHERLMC
jgi:hypothetical protein